MRQAGITDLAKLAAGFEKDLLLLFAPALLLILLGKFIEAFNEKRYYILPQYITYSGSIVLLWLLFSNAGDWVLGSLSFGDFFTSLLLVIVLMLLLLYLAREFKISLVAKMKLEGKTAYTEVGGVVGKVLDIDKKKGTLVVLTPQEQKFDISLDSVSIFDNRVIVRY